jgi:hypothetical protein
MSDRGEPRLSRFTALVRDGNWATREDLALGDLDGATLGIVGYGRSAGGWPRSPSCWACACSCTTRISIGPPSRRT